MLLSARLRSLQKSLFCDVEIWLLGRVLVTTPGVLAGSDVDAALVPVVLPWPGCYEMELEVTRTSDCPWRLPAR